MIHTNPDNPINLETILAVRTVRKVNALHRDMLVNIEQAYPSTALQQVSAHQYAEAVSDLMRAFNRVRLLQLDKRDMAEDNLPALHELGLEE